MEDRFETVSPQELEELRAENGEIELRRYNAEVNVFRADVALRLQRLGLDTGSSWAHYKTDAMCEPDYGFSPSDIDVFLLRNFYRIKTAIVPNIRLFRVERFYQPGGLERVVTEVIVDRDGDSVVTFGSKYYEGPKGETFEPELEGDGPVIEKIDFNRPLVVPIIEDGKLHFEGILGNGPVVRQVIDELPDVGTEDLPDAGIVTIAPFGDWVNIHDKFNALGRAIGIFSEVKSLVPDFFWVAGSK